MLVKDWPIIVIESMDDHEGQEKEMWSKEQIDKRVELAVA